MTQTTLEHPELPRIREAMRTGARLDVVRLLFRHPGEPTHGVEVYENGTTRGGNHKWVKVPLLLIPAEDQTLGELLQLLGDMTKED